MKLGVIGYGNRISGMIRLMEELDPECRVTAVTDVQSESVKKRLQDSGKSIEGIHFYETPEQMFEMEQLDGICIGTRCSLHTKMAVKVISRGIPLFLEKPVSTTMQDLTLLRQTYVNHPQMQGKIVVSFPLRITPLVKLVKEIVESGRIGTIEHAQAVNNVPYGGVYYHNWYRDENETGGLFLQKATHDFDYINHVLGNNKPIRVCAMTSKQIFKGDKAAKLMCKDCDEQETCTESPQNLAKAGEHVHGEYCSFAKDTGNEDSGSALIEYESGMHVAYSQNFFARKQAGKRGARFLGYKGTIEFDWFTSEAKVFMHQTPRTEVYKIDDSQLSHGGGDAVLAQNFIDIMRGKSLSESTMEDGLLSALMCLKAKESAATHMFQDIAWD